MKSSRRPGLSLVLQSALIVLPVVILSATSLYFLREDRGAIERDAREQAQRIAGPMARDLAARLDGMAREPQGEIGAGGEIVSPKDYARLPVPADWPNQLTPAQSALWAAAQRAVYQQKDPQAARQALGRISTASAPAALRLNAELGLLRLDPNIARAISLARKSAGVLTESGTPVADLALLIALRVGRVTDELLSAIETAMNEHPSFLTRELLDAGPRLQEKWAARERTLGLLRALGRRPETKWLDSEGAPYLALVKPAPRGWTVALLPGSAVEEKFRSVVAEQREISAYAAASFEIAGVRIPAGAGGSPLAVAERGAPYPFTVRLEIAKPELLYSGYRRRVWLTSGLVLSAAGAALLGMASLWRGFRRQVRLSEMKSDFVSSVSHELRAPIAAVQLMAESLEHGRVTDVRKQQDYYHLIVQECRRLSALVENVLDFSRIDRGSKQYRFEPVDIVALVRRTVVLMEPCAAARNVHISLEEPDAAAADLRPCWDDHAVEQTLVNLLDNAIKHSPAGSPVKVGIDVAQAGDMIRFWVQDQGEGIPSDAQARIFELFYRHGSELRRETPGVGIGLSIVKHVAEAHGGRVLVESAVGQGSRFALELPLSVPT